MSAPTILIMAGGTGGHIFPALAVAKELREQGWRVVWLGNPDGMEARLVPAQGYEAQWVRFGALRGKGLLRKLMLPVNLLRGLRQALAAIRAINPDVVLGFGGYITFPGGLMARLVGKPLIIHEQNAIPGLANKVLAKLAGRVLCGFPDALKKGRWVGNPVRREITQVPPPAERFVGREGPLKLLVLGGSLGAAALNEMVPQGLALLPHAERPQVIHQAGEKHLEMLRSNYATAGVAAECVSFIDDMAAAYAWADLVICRSGALTVAELAATGVASVLVPFPHAVDDHQTVNAQFLAHAGGAVLLPQSTLTPENVALIRNYSRQQLQQMAEKARELARPDAAAAVAGVCREAVKK